MQHVVWPAKRQYPISYIHCKQGRLRNVFSVSAGPRAGVLPRQGAAHPAHLGRHHHRHLHLRSRHRARLLLRSLLLRQEAAAAGLIKKPGLDD